jgi:hypothetical protein
MDNWVKVFDENDKVYYYNKLTKETRLDNPSSSVRPLLKEKNTLSDFMKTSQLLEKPKPRIGKIPTYLYDKIDKHLPLKQKTYMDLLTSPKQRNITDKEMKESIESDADKLEDQKWEEYYDPDDNYDREYDPDFSADWDEPPDDEYQVFKKKDRNAYAPSEFDFAVAYEISDTIRNNLNQKFPNLPLEIIDNALMDGRNAYLLLFEGTLRPSRNSIQEARNTFFDSVMESINRQKKTAYEVVKTILFAQTRHYQSGLTSTSELGSFLLQPGQMQIILERFDNLFIELE